MNATERDQRNGMSARISPADTPWDSTTAAAFDEILPPGVEPLALFTTLARDTRLFVRFRNGALLDRGNITLRQREIVINRTAALNGSEYEWGVHVAFFAERARIDDSMLQSLVHGGADDRCWSPEEALLIRACDQLNADADIDDALWSELKSHFSDGGLIEVIMLAGFYRTVSYLTNALRLPLEEYAPRFPAPSTHNSTSKDWSIETP